MIKSMLFALAFAIAGASLISKTPYGNSEDVAFATKLWAKLEKARIVGAARINSAPFEGNEPHGSIQQVLKTTILIEGRQSQVIVKANHVGDNANSSSVYKNPDKFLIAYTVMLKREAGYDPQNQNWFWVKYKRNGKIENNLEGMAIAGRVAKGEEFGCISCHTLSGGKDMQVLTKE